MDGYHRATATVVGLPNYGNTCYLNALLQCLGSCRALKTYILNLNVPPASDNDEKHVDKELLRLLMCFFSNDTSRHRELLQAMHKQFKQFIYVFEQNDINEMYSILLEYLSKACGRKLTEQEMSRVNDLIGKRVNALSRNTDVHWYKHHKDEYSNLCGIMYGQHINQVHCQTCQSMHHNFEVFANIMVSVDETHGRDLQQCVRSCFNDEFVGEWQCDKCKCMNASNTKTVRNWRNPKVLTVTLKRFSAAGAKIQKKVRVPLVLDISDVSIGYAQVNAQVTYQLKAAACHHGSYTMGHYTAIVNREGQWYIVDDESIHAIEQEDVINRYLQECYMFFYEQQ